jgi:hypothetical protein
VFRRCLPLKRARVRFQPRIEPFAKLERIFVAGKLVPLRTKHREGKLVGELFDLELGIFIANLT